MADGDSIINWDDLIGKTDVFDELSANIKQIEKELLAMVKATDKAFASLNPNDSAGLDKVEKKVIANEKATKELIKTKKEANKVRKKTIDLTNEQLIQLQSEKIAQRERVARAKQQAIIDKEGKQNIASLRAQLSLATLDWKKLTAEEAKNSKEGRKLVATKKTLTKQLKKLEEQTDDHRRSVGKYNKALGKLGRTAARVFIARNAIDFFRSMSSGVSNLIKENRDANESINSLGNAIDRAGGALKSAAVGILTFFAPALEIMANGISAVIGFFTGATASVDTFSATSDELKGVTDGLNKEFAKESANLQVVFSRLSEANEGSQERKDLIDEINTAYGKYLPNLLTEESTLKDIAKAQQLANDALSQQFLLKIQQATLTDVVTNKINDQISTFKALQAAAGGALEGNQAQFTKVVESINDADSAVNRIATSLTGNIFEFDRFNDVLAETDPKLAKFLGSIKKLSPEIRRNLVENMQLAGRRTRDYNAVMTETNETISDVAKSMTIYDHSVKETTKSVTGLADAETKATSDRLASIESLQRELEAAEVDNIEDKNARLIALEELRFKEEQRVRAEGYEEIKVLTIEQGGDLVQLDKINNDLIEEQKTAHKANLLNIERGFQDKLNAEFEATAAEELAASDKFQKEESAGAAKAAEDARKELEKETALFLKADKEANDERLKNNKELLNNILEVQQKIGGLINDLFQKQVDLSAKAVTDQEGNLERARQRAADGLDSNLVYEEQQLSKRQAENRKRQEEAKNIAKIVALFNLTSAAAASGDKNAVTTAITQFGVLTGFEALFNNVTGFEQGTENVEGSLGKGGAVRSGTDGYLGVTGSGKAFRFDGSERIVNGADNLKLGGMSNEDLVPNALLGSAMSDYFDKPSMLANNSYKQQQESFKKAVADKQTNDNMLNELKGIKAQLSSQPNYSAQITKVQEELHEFVLTENKGNMKKIIRRLLRGK